MAKKDPAAQLKRTLLPCYRPGICYCQSPPLSTRPEKDVKPQVQKLSEEAASLALAAEAPPEVGQG